MRGLSRLLLIGWFLFCTVTYVKATSAVSMTKNGEIFEALDVIQRTFNDEMLLASPENSLSCYETIGDSEVIRKCQFPFNSCALATIDATTITMPLTHFRKTVCFCADMATCSHPDEFCQYLKKKHVYGITINNCKMTCCSTDECNKPTHDTIIKEDLDYGQIQLILVEYKSKYLMKPSSNSLQCYKENSLGQPELIQCSPDQDECGTVFVSTGKGKMREAHMCADHLLCSKPEKFCKYLEKHETFKITSCSFQCCVENGCNKPFIASIGKKATNDTASLGRMDDDAITKAMNDAINDVGNPENALTCYQTQNDGSVPRKACENFMNNCETIALDVKMGAFSKHINLYACGVQIFCANPSLICDDIRKHPPSHVKIVSCSVKCCSVDGCNKPADELVENQEPRKQNRLQESLPKTSNNELVVSTCYVSVAYNNTTLTTCPTFNPHRTCGVASFDINISRTNHVKEYICVDEELLKHPERFCKKLKKKKTPFLQITDCKLDICSGMGCNSPN